MRKLLNKLLIKFRITSYNVCYTKLLRIAALIFFLLGGKILWSVGFCMGAGQFIGARLGSRMVVKKGSKIIRPLLVSMSLIMSARLLWRHYFPA